GWWRLKMKVLKLAASALAVSAFLVGCGQETNPQANIQAELSGKQQPIQGKQEPVTGKQQQQLPVQGKQQQQPVTGKQQQQLPTPAPVTGKQQQPVEGKQQPVTGKQQQLPAPAPVEG